MLSAIKSIKIQLCSMTPNNTLQEASISISIVYRVKQRGIQLILRHCTTCSSPRKNRLKRRRAPTWPTCTLC